MSLQEITGCLTPLCVSHYTYKLGIHNSLSLTLLWQMYDCATGQRIRRAKTRKAEAVIARLVGSAATRLIF